MVSSIHRKDRYDLYNPIIIHVRMMYNLCALLYMSTAPVYTQGIASFPNVPVLYIV